MRAWLFSPKVHLGGLLLLLLGSGLYCLSDRDCSLWTPDQRGYRLFGQADYTGAAKRFSDPMWKGVALFRQGEFEQAASLFAGYDSAEAGFNQGNALVMQGKYTLAVERYDRSLQHRPGWEDAEVNRRIASARADMLEQEGGDMTGGKIGADEIVFDKGKSSPDAGEEKVQGGQEMTDARLRSIWLRQVQTRPADFLRAKFAQQYAAQSTRDR